MIGVSLMWLVSMAGVLLVIVLCVMVLARALIAPPGLDRMASCGACGHSLHALDSGRCPECGADLTKGGVATRAMIVRLRGSTLEAIRAWTILVAGLGSAVGGIVLSMLAFNAGFGGGNAISQWRFTTTLEPQRDWSGADTSPPADYEIEFAVDVGIDSRSRADSGTIVATLWRGYEEHTLELDASDNSWVLSDGFGNEIESGETFDETTVELLYATAGLDLEETNIQMQMRDLTEAIKQSQRQPRMSASSWNLNSDRGGLRDTNTSYAVMPRPSGFESFHIGTLIVILIGLAVYIAGIFFIVMRRGTLMRAATAGAG